MEEFWHQIHLNWLTFQEVKGKFKDQGSKKTFYHHDALPNQRGMVVQKSLEIMAEFNNKVLR